MTADASSDFTDLYQAHYATVLRMMRRYLPELDAEDAAQNTFVRAWRHWPPKHDQVQRWLYKIAASVLVDAIRRRRVNQGRFVLMEAEFPPENDGYFITDSPEDAILDRVVRAQRRRLVAGAWSLLTPNERRAVEELLMGAVRIHRARHKLTRAVRAAGTRP